MIEVKTFFSDWHEISKEQAIEWALHKYNHCGCSSEKITSIINSRLRGIQFTVQQLSELSKERRSENGKV